MPTELKKIGSKFFIYLVAFVLMFSFVVLFVLGLQTRQLRDNISDSFTEFSNDVNDVSKKMINENEDVFIENYVNIEANAFAYAINQLKLDLQYFSDSLVLRYEDYEKDSAYYLNLAKNNTAQSNLSNNLKNSKKVKVFYQTGIDKQKVDVEKDLGILLDIEDELVLTTIDETQIRNAYVLTENGVAMFAANYDYSNSPKYAGEELDYKSEDWYKNAIATTSIILNSSYKDVLSDKDIISVDKSYRVNGKVLGVISIEVYIDSLNNSNLNLVPPEHANLFIVDNNNKLIYNARANLYNEETAKKGTIHQFLDGAKGKESGRGSYVYNGNEYRCFYRKVKDTEFTLYVSIRENRLKESINKLQVLLKDKNDLLIDKVYETSRYMYLYVLLFAIIVIIITFFVANNVSAMLQMPIHELSTILGQARKIQQDMLPAEFVKISNRRDIEIFADNIPESEVGGDFYNYIIRNNKLYLIIADVSGSGMPAALFMAKTNTLLNNAIKLTESPRVILSYVNAELCKNNKECYFVTIALYCVDLKTRKVVYANSGHENSIIIKSNNEIIIKEEIRSAPMGLDAQNNYNEDEFYLEDGDVLFLYTDGVVEAINKNKELFGMDRLINKLKTIGAIDTKSIVQKLEKELDEFQEGLEQYDDITMLCFKFKKLEIDNNNIIKNIKTFSALYENVVEVDKFVEECLKAVYADNTIYEKYLSQLSLCIEEIVVNICDYAYDTINDTNNIFSVEVLIDKNIDKLLISFIDSGKKFDPTKMKDVNILQGVDERNIGGFGIHITKNIVDVLEYNRENNKNILTITKYL